MKNEQFYLLYWKPGGGLSEVVTCPSFDWGVEMLRRLSAGYPLENVGRDGDEVVYPIEVRLVQILHRVVFPKRSKSTKKGASIDK